MIVLEARLNALQRPHPTVDDTSEHFAYALDKMAAYFPDNGAALVRLLRFEKADAV